MPACFQAKAEGGFDFVGEVATSNKSVEFLSVDGDTGDPQSFVPKFLTLDYAITVLYQNLYARFKLSQTIQDDVLYDGDIILASRSDVDFALGYYLGAGVSVFAGHKRGVFEANVVGNETIPPTQNIRVKFTDSGPYVGMSYALPLSESSLSLSFAYADMDGEVSATAVSAGLATAGDTTGFSYSVAWSKPVSDSTNFTAGLNLIRYDFDDKELNFGVDFDTRQRFDIISIGFVHYF